MRETESVISNFWGFVLDTLCTQSQARWISRSVDANAFMPLHHSKS